MILSIVNGLCTNITLINLKEVWKPKNELEPCLKTWNQICKRNIGHLQATSNKKIQIPSNFNNLKSCSQTYMFWSSNAFMLTHAFNNSMVVKELGYTFVWVQISNLKTTSKFKRTNFDNSKKNYDIENVQYHEIAKAPKIKWFFFEKTPIIMGKKTLNKTLKTNSMGCYQKETQSWKWKKFGRKK
jgi:hypothetical protein